MRIAVVGSADPDRRYDPPLRNHVLADTAAAELGRELAGRGCEIAVYSGRPDFIEASVVRGYVASGQAQPGSIHVHGRYGREDASFPEIAQHRNLFDVHPESTADWEVAYFRSLLNVEGMLLLGGGRSTFTAGLIALSRGIPLAPVAAFGGGAEKAWHRWSRESDCATEDDIKVMADSWHPTQAAGIVSSLTEQHHRRELQRAEAGRQERRADRRMATSLVIGMVLLLLALAMVPLSYTARSGSAGSVAILVAAPLLAAICGAIVRNAFDAAGSWLRTIVLGAAAGSISFLLFIAAQLAATPDALNGEGVRRLVFFVLPVGFIAGLTFDAVHAKLQSQDVTRTSTLER
ncbi:hypothetical protein [Streptomyces sp. NPDC053542]|uniref:hypothetical protein n=1 Tax=Streptomyces sp. NPDC053542 TaxID=3365710 RepID=UPI0037D07856